MPIPLQDYQRGDLTNNILRKILQNQARLIRGDSSLHITGGGSGAVTQLIAGTGISLSPPAGTGAVTITATGGGSGTVTSVAFTGGLISVANPTTAAALTVAGTSGGIPYFSSTSAWASSALLAQNALLIGGGAGAAPASTTTGTGVLTALGVNVGSAGAFVTFNGALGTPSSGTVTNLTGTASININGTVGATTPGTGVFTTLVAGSTTSLLLGTAGSAVGNIGFRNATSGTATLAPPTGALGTYTVTLPNAASTLPIASQQLTFTGPSTARTITLPDANITVARTDAANTFTGVQTMTSPSITTSLVTASATFALLNTTATTVNAFGAATTLNIGASATCILNFGGSTTASEFRFLEPSGSGTNYTAFKAQAQGSSITYTLPATVGGAGTVLTDAAGNGTLSWAAAGAGTVTVVAAGSLTSTALVTGGGSQTLQTPSATATLDSSGNLSTPGSISLGVGGSVGGYSAFAQGTATTAPTSSVGFMAPTSVTTKFMMTLPAAPITGFLLNTGTTDPSTISFVAFTGSANVMRSTDPTLDAGKLQLAENASIALDPAGSADGKYSGITFTGTSGYSMAFGDVVMLDPNQSPARWELASVSAAVGAVGDCRGNLAIVVVTATDGNTATLMKHGIIRADANFPTLTVNGAVYATTTGDITSTQPSTTDHVIRILGHALTADEIYFAPDNTWITHT